MKTFASLLSLSTLVSGAAFAAPAFVDIRLAFMADAYARLAKEAPANDEYMLKINFGDVALLPKTQLLAGIKGALLNLRCTDNIYDCPEKLTLKALKGADFDAASSSVGGVLSSSRPDARKSEHFFDLSTAFAELAAKESGAVVLVGTESNSFGAAHLIVAVSQSTGEAMVIGSGYAE